MGRHCTWGSSPRASFAPQGATGSTATPATRVKILIKMRFLPGSHRSETYSGGSDVLSQTERKNENYYGFCGLLSASWVIMGSVCITSIIIYLDCHNHEVEKLTEHKTTKVDVVSERKRC